MIIFSYFFPLFLTFPTASINIVENEQFYHLKELRFFINKILSKYINKFQILV